MPINKINHKRRRLLPQTPALTVSLLITFGTLLVNSAVVIKVSAETIAIPIGQQHPELQTTLPQPSRGQLTTQVISEFGEPVQKFSPRGEPPITRWEYPGFFVFFEHNHVIHSVIKHRPNEAE